MIGILKEMWQSVMKIRKTRFFILRIFIFFFLFFIYYFAFALLLFSNKYCQIDTDYIEIAKHYLTRF